ncbi:molybdenum ABC transporter ATP-binding protein [Hyphococcus luteus]|uniref:Molybdenum ABC transporter ATP-binding protein n=1 Tax=Hyphococcus luteus TaxID=2058213 RepID=A0A2S7K0U0_9PROT|nr:molybdenum ABC transporter ATP-binding protein [Marinicaulis flavus]PQA86071.1 molybdenum ABC transporter ATP-binding protein [Marinicaulis flavus]
MTINAAFKGNLGDFTLDAAFEILAKGVAGLFGPSGGGKTTILRCIAGLERFSGNLSVNGEVWQDDAAKLFRKPHQRAVGYVFQEASLFPHLSVRRNLLFGAERGNKTGAGETFKLDDLVDLLGLSALMDRAPAALSGGERQRVAMGRALMSSPRLLLLDEPLSALDRQTKEELFPYLEDLHEALSIPSLYVSHDMSELERLADTLVLIDKGRVIASGPLHDLQADPALPLMSAPEAAVALTGRTNEIDKTYGLVTLAVNGGTLIVPSRQARLGEERRLSIKASDVSFTRAAPQETSILNCLPVKILSANVQERDPTHVNIVAALGENGEGARIVGRITRKSQEKLGLTEGANAYAQIKSIALAP